MNISLFLTVLLSAAEATMPDINEILEILENSQSLIEAIGGLILAVITFISIIGTAIASVLGIASSAFALIFTIVVFVGVIVLALLKYLALAIPLFVVARHAKSKFAWLAWIPIFQDLFAVLVMWKASGKESFELFKGKFRIKNSIWMMLTYVLFDFCGDTIVWILIVIVNMIPGLGQLAGLIIWLLGYLPKFVMAMITYVYMRDLLDVFKPDKKKNQVHAAVVVILDALLTFGWARTIYLVTMMRKKPLPKTEPVYNPAPIPEDISDIPLIEE